MVEWATLKALEDKFFDRLVNPPVGVGKVSVDPATDVARARSEPPAEQDHGDNPFDIPNAEIVLERLLNRALRAADDEKTGGSDVSKDHVSGGTYFRTKMPEGKWRPLRPDWVPEAEPSAIIDEALATCVDGNESLFNLSTTPEAEPNASVDEAPATYVVRRVHEGYAAGDKITMVSGADKSAQRRADGTQDIFAHLEATHPANETLADGAKRFVQLTDGRVFDRSSDGFAAVAMREASVRDAMHPVWHRRADGTLEVEGEDIKSMLSETNTVPDDSELRAEIVAMVRLAQKTSDLECAYLREIGELKRRLAMPEEPGNHPYHGSLSKPDTTGKRHTIPDPVHERFHHSIGDVLSGRLMPEARKQMREALDAAPKHQPTTASTDAPMPGKTLAVAGDPRRLGFP